MSTTPLISVQIVAYNAEKTLSKTLGSVAAQQGVAFEIIAVNDASTDRTLELFEEFAQKYPNISYTLLSNERNLGIAKSRNKALAHSNGAFIAVLDSDDTWSNPFKLKKQLEFLETHPDYIVIGTQMRIVDPQDNLIETTSHATSDASIRRDILAHNHIGHSSSLIRNTGFSYDESLYIWEDYDLFLRLGLQGKLANIDEALVTYLQTPKNYPLSKRLTLVCTEFEIIKRYRSSYPNFWKGALKSILKYILALLPVYISNILRTLQISRDFKKLFKIKL